MAEHTRIEWCDHTMNFWIGCQEVSPACDNCYARVQNAHWKWVNGWGPEGERRRTSASNWHQLRRWDHAAERAGVRRKVFSNSLADFFDNAANYTWRREAWHYIEQSPHLDFLILTKRPQNIAKMLPDPETGVKPWGNGWPNVWLGTTAENQEEADRRIPHLLRVPARVRFLSCEPLLAPIFPTLIGIHWVICGGESGPGARPMHPDWARSLRDQCQAAGVPFFFKQWGEWCPETGAYLEPLKFQAVPLHLWPDLPPYGYSFRRGKKAAGAMLDGREWREFPDAP